MTRRPKKELSSEDRKLWKQVTDTVTPKTSSHQLDEEFAVAMAHLEASKTPKKINLKTSSSSMPIAQSPTAVSDAKKLQKTLPPLHRYTKREKSRLSRGLIDIDGTLDLHGLTQNQAHRKLFHFIDQSIARGWKNLLVITGKGRTDFDHTQKAYSDGMRETPGVLRRKVPQWLSDPSIRNKIIGYETAGPSHGGNGALLVRLRKG